MKSRYADNQFAPMAPGETATPVVDDAPRYKERRAAPNDYPEGSVPKESGWQAREGAISRIPGNNAITVCRGRKPERYSRGS